MQQQNTQCSLSNLTCGQEYTVVVIAMHAGCPGPASQPVNFTTAPCSPEPVETQLNCLSGSLNITWQLKFGAIHYQAMVQGGNNVMMCDTNSTSCVVSNLSCGNNYNVTVVAQGQTCNCSQCKVKEISTAPCPPTNVSATLECSSNNAVVSWNSQNALGVAYSAQALDAQGSLVSCNTTGSNCALIGLQCGSNYSVTVTASNGNCSSLPSLAYTFITVPCQPLLSAVQLLCSSDSASVTWTTASATPEQYEVTAVDDQGETLQCNSSDVTSCQVSSLQCGRQYGFSVTASNKLCSSAPSATIQSIAAPCPPQNVTISVGCENSTTSISWSSSQGALSYTAKVLGAGGEKACCSSNTSSCDITSLPCGEMYNVTVAAKGHTCNSSQSSETAFKTGACVPLHLSVSYNFDVALLSWDAAKGATNYTAQATSNQVLTSTCLTNATDCFLTSFTCGKIYNVTVSAGNSACSNTAPSDTYALMTEPCLPSNVHASMDYNTLTANVSWQGSDAAIGYFLVLDGQNGQSINCSATATSCVIGGLPCGTVFSVQVRALGQQFNSSMTSGVSLTSAPCIPSTVQTQLFSGSDAVLLSWNYTGGETNFTLSAMGIGGNEVSCSTRQNNCTITGLLCGEQYNVSLTATTQEGQITIPVNASFNTCPCAPPHVSVNLTYGTQTATLSWENVSGVERYVSSATRGSDGALQHCNTTGSVCQFTSLTCGEMYNFTVTAQSNGYDSVPSKTVQVHTAPCIPSTVQTQLFSGSDAVLLSWNYTGGETNFTLSAIGIGGNEVSCSTRQNNCTITGLLCGEQYNVSLTATTQEGQITVPVNASFNTSPCIPSTVQTQLFSGSDAVLLSWNYTGGETNFTLSAMGIGGNEVSCSTRQNNCTITGLLCGEQYNISLTATTQEGQITEPVNASFNTCPCAPPHVSVNLTYGTQTATLSWENVSGVERYVSSATRGSDGALQHCNTTGSVCQFTSLTCGEMYNFTVTAQSNGYDSLPSKTVQVHTVTPMLSPCPLQPHAYPALCRPSFSVGVCARPAVLELHWWESELHPLCHGYWGSEVSCSTRQNNCTITGLLCGEQYNISLTATTQEGQITEPVNASFNTCPCAPPHVSVNLTYGTQTATLSWENVSGVERYVSSATRGSDGALQYCNTTGSVCQFTSLTCGEMYNFTVTAQSNGYDSLPSKTVQVHTAPCQPVMVTSHVLCNSTQVLVSWLPASGAALYIVTVTGNLGYAEAFNTTNTSMTALMPCGQTYNVTLLGHDLSFGSPPSIPVSFTTAPCVPQDVRTDAECKAALGSVSWASSNGTNTYTAVAIGQNGDTHNCVTSNTSCTWSNLLCGENYTVLVTASNNICTSAPGNSAVIQMAPCVPQDVVAILDYSENIVYLNWNLSEGAEAYTVAVNGTGNANMEINSINNFVRLSMLSCGQNYSVTVTAANQYCKSAPSVLADIQTFPCTPVGIAVVMICANNTAVVSWNASQGAVWYSVSANSSGGSSTCSSSDLSCTLVNLTCGTAYNVQVVAVDNQCSSNASLVVPFHSVPCTPAPAVSTLDCFNNSILMAWAHVDGAVFYTATASYSGQKHRVCRTNNTSCQVSNMTCGQVFSVSMVASDSQCDSPPSASWNILAVPCAPQNITTQLDCSADFGQQGLLCSDTYNVSVVAINQQCNISSSTVTQLHTVPCVPSMVVGNVSCQTAEVSITWQQSLGAEAYTVMAQGSGGYESSCNTSGTTCVFKDLLCEHTYSVSRQRRHRHMLQRLQQPSNPEDSPLCAPGCQHASGLP
ncbi:hypothetical protein UPYG_G00295510 [Umbra pygmaea]|uniref:Fibronectin type-III domain-containing protein n=1 Tax=Umbra pygmaea TaxID=75934 RepID=A0ABD0WNX3_UMBPY